MVEHVSEGALDAKLLDVGVGGMALLSASPAPSGYLRIRFKLGPDSGEFDVGGVVVRERHQDGYRVWGIEFHGVDLGTRVRLRDYVAREQRRSGSFPLISVQVQPEDG